MTGWKIDIFNRKYISKGWMFQPVMLVFSSAVPYSDFAKSEILTKQFAARNSQAPKLKPRPEKTVVGFCLEALVGWFLHQGA